MESDVLVYAALRKDAAMVEHAMGAEGMAVRICHSPVALEEELSAGVGVLLIVEELLAGEVLRVLTRHLASQPAWSDLPILLMAAHGAASAGVRVAVEQLGNVTLLERPVRRNALTTAARSALRGRNRQYEVRALNAGKDQFLASLAHELRNPLAPIRSASAVLQRMQVDASTARMTAIIDRQIQHLTRLVDDLLDVARATSGKLELQVSRTTCHRVVSHAIEIADAQLREKGHRLVVEQPEHDAALQADHVRLVQSIANLLVNAAKFTPNGGEVHLAVRVHGEDMEISVTDTGRGLAEADLQRVFTIFEQARAPGEVSKGLGLGLHLVKTFTEMHGGEVTAYSQGVGQGSRFVMQLPVVSEETSTQ